MWHAFHLCFAWVDHHQHDFWQLLPCLFPSTLPQVILDSHRKEAKKLSYPFLSTKVVGRLEGLYVDRSLPENRVRDNRGLGSLTPSYPRMLLKSLTGLGFLTQMDTSGCIMMSCLDWSKLFILYIQLLSETGTSKELSCTWSTDLKQGWATLCFHHCWG